MNITKFQKRGVILLRGLTHRQMVTLFRRHRVYDRGFVNDKQEFFHNKSKFLANFSCLQTVEMLQYKKLDWVPRTVGKSSFHKLNEIRNIYTLEAYTGRINYLRYSTKEFWVNMNRSSISNLSGGGITRFEKVINSPHQLCKISIVSTITRSL